MTAACLALLVLGIGLLAGGWILAAVAVLIAGGAAASVVRFDVTRLLVAATCASAFATGFPEVYFGSVRVRLAIAVLALLLSVASLLRGSRLWLPWWILTPAGAVVLATALV